ERVLFKVIKGVWRTLCEWIIRHKSIDDVLLLLAHNMAKLQRQSRRNRDCAGSAFIVMRDLGRSRRRQDSADDIVAVIGTHASHHGIDVAGLTTKVGFREVG